MKVNGVERQDEEFKIGERKEEEKVDLKLKSLLQEYKTRNYD